MTERTVYLPGGKARVGSRLIVAVQIVLAVGLLAAILFSMQGNTGQKRDMPEQLAGMKLVKHLEGKEAVSQMNQLHGTDIGVTGGFLAEYAGASQRLSVWVGKTNGEAAAAELLRIMTDKIAAGNPTFTGLQKSTLEGKTVFSVQSREGRHYYYQSGDAVVWLAVQAPEPLSVAREALRTF